MERLRIAKRTAFQCERMADHAKVRRPIPALGAPEVNVASATNSRTQGLTLLSQDFGSHRKQLLFLLLKKIQQLIFAIAILREHFESMMKIGDTSFH